VEARADASRSLRHPDWIVLTTSFVSSTPSVTVTSHGILLVLLTAFWSIHHLGGEGAFAERTMVVASAGDHLVTLRVSSVRQILSHWHGHFGGNFLSKLSLFGFKWDIATRLALSLMLTMLGVQGSSIDVTASI
jgi:hypothetical protein